MPYMTNAMSCDIPFAAAAAAGTRAIAGRATSLVDKNEGGFLITGRKVKSRSCRDTKGVDHCERRLSCSKQLRVREVRDWRELWEFLEGFYSLSRRDFSRMAVMFEEIDRNQWPR